MTYKGYTIDELKSVFDYNPDTGVFTSRVSDKVLEGRVYSHRHPKTKKSSKLYLARVAVMLFKGEYLEDGDRVLFLDGDPYNNKISNLSVVPFKEIYQHRANNPVNEYIETDEPYVFVGTLNREFVVRRTNKQAVYRTYSKEEAVGVRDRWLESGKTLHEWDKFTPKWFTDLIKNE